MKKHLQALGGAALIVAFIFLALELLLQAFDPWGLRYFDDLLRIGNELFVTDDMRGYKIPDGAYQFSNWEVTIDAGARLTPANTPDATCSIVLLGDSVTFAHGVNDADTWANQLSLVFPDVKFINAGMTTYNSENARGSHDAFNGDAYVYLVVYNDIEGTLNPDPYAFPDQNPTNLPQLIRYTNFVLFGRKPNTFDEQTLPPLTDPNLQRFLDDIESLMSNDNVWLATFDGSPLNDLITEQGYALAVYPYPEQQNSFVDNHWNAAGNAAFATEITPLITEIVTQVCDS